MGRANEGRWRRGWCDSIRPAPGTKGRPPAGFAAARRDEVGRGDEPDHDSVPRADESDTTRLSRRRRGVPARGGDPQSPPFSRSCMGQRAPGSARRPDRDRAPAPAEPGPPRRPATPSRRDPPGRWQSFDARLPPRRHEKPLQPYQAATPISVQSSPRARLEISCAGPETNNELVSGTGRTGGDIPPFRHPSNQQNCFDRRGLFGRVERDRPTLPSLSILRSRRWTPLGKHVRGLPHLWRCRS